MAIDRQSPQPHGDIRQRHKAGRHRHALRITRFTERLQIGRHYMRGREHDKRERGTGREQCRRRLVESIGQLTDTQHGAHIQCEQRRGQPRLKRCRARRQ